MTDYRDTVGKKKQRQTGFSIGGVIDDAQDAVDDAVGSVGGTVDDAVGGIDDTVDNVGGGIDDVVDDVGGGIDDAVDDVGGGIDDAVGNVGDTVDDAVGGVDDAFDNAGDLLDDTTQDIDNAIDDSIGGFQDQLGDIGSGAGDAFGDITGGIDEAFDDAIDAGQGFAGGIDDTFDDAIDTGQDFAGGIDDTIDNTFDDIGSLVPDVQAPDVDGIIDNASGEVNDAFDDFTDFGGDVAEGAGDFFGDVSEEAGDFGEGAGDFFGDVTEGADNIFDETVDETTEFAGDVGDALGSSADNIGDIAGGIFGGAADLAGDVGGGAANLAGSAANLGLDVVDGALDTVLFTPLSVGQDFIQGSIEKISSIGGGGLVGNPGDTTTKADGTQDGTPVQWSEASQVTTVTGAVILKQEALNTPDQRVRFFAIGQDKSGDKVAFGANNKAVKVDSVESLGELPHFDTLQAAKEAVPHRGGRNNERNESDTRWDKPQKVNQIGAVSILEQTGQDSSGGQVTRYLAATQTDQENKVFLKSATEVVPVNEIDTLDDAPSFDTQEEAERVATQYMRSLQGPTGGSGGPTPGGGGSGTPGGEGGEPMPQPGGGGSDSGGEGEGSVEWGQAEQVGQVQDVIILEQTGQTPDGEEKTRYLAATQNQSGETLLIKSATEAVRVESLQSSGEIPSFESQEEAESVAQEYVQTPEDEKSVSDPPTSGTGSSGDSGLLGGFSPVTLGAGALAIGGGLYTLYGGEGKKGKKKKGKKDNNGSGMSGLSVKANKNNGPQGQ